MKHILYFIILISVSVNAQDLVIKEVKRRPNKKIYNTTSVTIIYPIIILKNKTAADLINRQIRKEFFDQPNIHVTLDNLLTERIEEGLTDLDYTITFKNKNILSLQLNGEGCGAYCSSWNIYLNFDLNTGKQIRIEDLIQLDKFDSFKEIVFQQKTDTLQKYLAEEKEMFDRNEMGDLDSSDYDWIKGEVTNCMSNAAINVFSLKKTELEIIDPCDLPHAIQSQTPIYELKYSYLFLKPFLKKEFLEKLK
ncbi:MAG: hypothetical protein QM764_12990 [Chitinophagaceae bacterium]